LPRSHGDEALIAEHAGPEAIEVYGPPARLHEVEVMAQSNGWRTRRTGTSVSILPQQSPPDRR